MVFTIKRPTSRRYFKLSFHGFRPVGRNRVEAIVKAWLYFVTALYKYFFGKIADIFRAVSFVLYIFYQIPFVLKTLLVRKLIWSRGRLGRPIASAIIMSVSIGVFMLGEFFSRSRFVTVHSVDTDYISSVSDIIPKKEIALTTIPEMRKRTEYFKYNVAPGDSLYSIGNKFKTSVDALKYVNNLTDRSVLSVGQEITIPPISGLIHKVESGDTLTSIAEKYDVPVQAVADFNYLFNTTKLAVGTELVIPGAKVPRPVIPVTPITVGPSTGPDSDASPNKKFCVWPSTVRIVTQYYSWYHNGIDIATPTNGPMPPLLACTSGTVIRAGWDPFGLGLHVRIDHGGGYETIYGHMSRLDVSYGDKVKRGEILGLMGSTGNSTGPHVHFMVKYNGAAQNPSNYMN